MLEKINEDLKNALKNKEALKLSVLRMLKSSLQNEAIAKKKDLTDDEIQVVIKREVKKRKDSIVEYTKYEKLDTVKSLEEEIEILSSYLPEELSIEEINTLVDTAISKVNPDGIKGMGLVMKELNTLLQGCNADMSQVSAIVKQKLNK